MMTSASSGLMYRIGRRLSDLQDGIAVNSHDGKITAREE
jgi:hypothetical protein